MTNREVDAMHIVGDEFSYFDASKLNKKSMFDKDILTNQSLEEHVLDYCFSHLGINEDIQNSVVMTEALCNPNSCRAQTSELMFECYGVPQVAYAVDSICGAFSSGKIENSLIINSSFQSTHIIPILGGKIDLAHTKRIPVGGYHHSDLL